MPVILTRRCDTPGCMGRIDGECSLTFYDHRNSDLILSDGDLLVDDLDSAARAAGWRESLGDWRCPKCIDRNAKAYLKTVMRSA